MPGGTSNLVLLSGQIALSQAMDVVANNVANVSTTGFKREAISFDSFLGKGNLGTSKPTNYVYDSATYRDMSNGPTLKTGNPLDLAILGNGFFKVQMANGTTGYTRTGSFKLDTEGNITTQAGQQLIADGGPLSVPNTTSEINISADGYVTARTDNGSQLAQLGKITIVKFDDEQRLQPAGNGVYTTTQAATTVTDSTIQQAALEQSNVEPVTEVTNMIRIMRSYEQMSNMISTENQRSQDAINRLSKTAS